MKNVIIVGANEGIGYWLAKQLLEDGNNVGILDIRTDRAEDLKQLYKERLFVMKCDAKAEAEIDAAVEAYVKNYHHIDIAIHNACKCTFDSMEQTAEDVFHEVFDVNYFGALRLTRSVVRYMKESGGKVIFTSSGVGVMGFANISPYASTKGAIESFAKCMNIEYQKNNISFHIFHPPLTNTSSAAPLPVPKEFMMNPEPVGRGLAKNIDKKSFFICHNFFQTLQTKMTYLIPLQLGRRMSKMLDAIQK